MPDEFRVIADLTLSLILFIDASKADLKTIRRQIHIPARMLLLGLPGSIALGTIFAVAIFDGLSWHEASIIGTMLAATDAAHGKAVICNTDVPVRIREGLNAESGLNDGLCVPILLVFIALALGAEEGGTGLALEYVARELGIGLIVGVGLAAAGGWLLRLCWNKKWVTETWMHVAVVALALAIFSIAQSLHGSGYIAAFTGGLLFGFQSKDATHEMLKAAEADGETMAMLTWFAFGGAVIGQNYHLFTWEVVLYSVLSLTVIRMIPVFMSLIGTGESVPSRIFLGWFGPRGLASIVFAIIVLNSNIPNGPFMTLVVVCTVFLSLVAHGITANPLARWIARIEKKS